MLTVVLDTNVFVSSLLVKEGPPAQVLDAWRERAFLLVVSPAIIAEVQATSEHGTFSREQLGQMLDLAAPALARLYEMQRAMIRLGGQ